MSLGEVLHLVEVVGHELSSLDATVCSGADAALVVERLAALEKRCAAARARFGLRAAECGEHRESGAASPEQWMARLTGVALGRARAELETAAAVEAFPATRGAVASGEVSLAQAAEVVKTLETVPEAESELLDVARRHPMRSLQDRARRIRHRREDSDRRYRRQQGLRGGHHRQDAEGMTVLEAAFTPEIGALVVSVVEREADRLYRRASKRVRRSTPHSAFVADALANLILGRTDTGVSGVDVVVLVDLEALKRGHLHDGETCHVPGIGGIPVSLARQIAQDAFLKAVVHDGVDLKMVRHFRRHYSAELQTALRIGAPPDFDGTACVEEGCERRYGLERDHIDPLANDGPTCWENLVWRCRPHHRMKTERDRQAGLLRARTRRRRAAGPSRARTGDLAPARAP